MKKHFITQLIVYGFFIAILTMSSIEIVLSNNFISTFNNYLMYKKIILFKLTGDETIVKPLINVGILFNWVFICLTVLDLLLYAFQNHMSKKYNPFVTIFSTIQFIAFTVKIVLYAAWASQNSSQYTPYTQNQTFCKQLNIIVNKQAQQTMCSFADEWIYFIQLIFPYTLGFILIYCLFLSILFKSQKYAQESLIKKNEIHDFNNQGSFNMSEKFLVSPQARSYSN
ncbi:transmembrane protein, putative (macronuclear) [Tetrahymena thermophila SB210]|uniref:Transmembrane protein, putative n=1 Tax=Tetrahymena thermophila (strain SB210) TaxID=312017 RepID=I7MAN4_TETTS|nr:transmembrane protein, putative [Tetrahymena thermophila SB210]EAS04937.3 transmembrane protein, putative [Tetrahymena thermophila SB210]|eukprot:XP_001025182.3 transmembrane protein, putative [Tetrahymena thermophila SB210]